LSSKLCIISEYNPFHFGHLYHLNESISQTDTDFKIAIISGNFVQRGEPSIINKWEKAKVALSAGFDLVLELPTLYAISSAENFANGSIKIADQIGSNYISFGTESGDLEKLKKLSSLINKNEKEYITNVKEKIAEGFSYPKSQELVIDKMFGNEFLDVCKPNNILGLEYLKSLNAISSNITPITVKRDLDKSSSSDVRALLRTSGFKIEDLKNSIPDFSYEILAENIENGNAVLSLKAFEKEIIYILRTIDNEKLKNIPDVPENMLSNLKKIACSTNSLDELITALKNKSITQARIQRILLYILLGITKSDMELSKRITPYVRVLGMSENGKKILSDISKDINVITSVKAFEKTCDDSDLLRMLEIDKKATDIYTLAYVKDSVANLDYTMRIQTNF
jgi:predicted nucleotidyltransferase